MSNVSKIAPIPDDGHDKAAGDRGEQKLRWAEILIVVSLYFFLTLIATYPTVKFLNSHFIGNGDTLVNAWNLWWAQWSVSLGNAAPLHTTMLYHPDGVSLAYHTLDLLNGYLAVLLQKIPGLSLPATFNTISLMTTVASGLSTYLLVRSMTGSLAAAWVASLIFTFSPFRVGRVFFGNLDLYSTQFIPIMVWFLWRMSQTLRWREAVGAAAALSLTGWSSLELGFGTGILAMFLFALDLYGAQRLVARLKRWALFGVLTCAFMLPFILPMIRDYQSLQDQADQYGASVVNSADLLGFFIPDSATMPLIKRVGPPLVAQKIDQTYATFYGNPSEKTVFVGYMVLAMVILSLGVARSSVVRRWLVVAVGFFTLCLGPVLHVAGRSLLSPMPYALFFQLPLLKFGRSPSRLAAFLMLAFAIIVGHGCAALERRYRWFKWTTLLIGVLVFAEFLIIPFRLDDRAVSISAYYDQLAKEDQALAILDVPIDLYGAQGPASKYMLYQTVHHKPIVGGYISRTPRKLLWIFERPFLYQLRARIYGDTAPYTFSPDDMLHGPEDLGSLHVQYVILHRDELSGLDFRIVRQALKTLLSNPKYEDNAITVWQLDATVKDSGQ